MKITSPYRRLVAFLLAVAAGVTIMSGAFAASAENAYDANSAMPNYTRGVQPSAEQRAQMEKEKARREEEMQRQQESFSSLTDRQKKEIYDLWEKVTLAQQKLLERYAKYGVISGEAADDMKAHFERRDNMLRENGLMPGARVKTPKKLIQEEE